MYSTRPEITGILRAFFGFDDVVDAVGQGHKSIQTLVLQLLHPSRILAHRPNPINPLVQPNLINFIPRNFDLDLLFDPLVPRQIFRQADQMLRLGRHVLVRGVFRQAQLAE